MEIVNTSDQKQQPPIQMVVYGEGGVGKTTFAAKAPNVVIADCETGTKYLGSRGIDVDVAPIKEWMDFVEFIRVVRKSDYETVVIDPIGELMDKLQNHMLDNKGGKLVQSDGSPTMAGWGWLKRTMRQSLKTLRDTRKNVVIVAHVDEKEDEDRMIKRPLLQTKLSEELINMVDVVAFMTVIEDKDNPEKSKRVLICDPESDKYVVKDRTGTLDRYEKPDWDSLLVKINGSDFWSEEAKDETPEEESETKPETKPDEESMDDVVDEFEEESDSKNEPEQPDISLLGLNAGAEKALREAGIKTVTDLTSKTEKEVSELKGIGEATVKEIKEILSEVGKGLAEGESDLSERLKNQN
jgi:phage nucleotide-binding protein